MCQRTAAGVVTNSVEPDTAFLEHLGLHCLLTPVCLRTKEIGYT